MALILGGAGALLYRSLWMRKGHCQGCANTGCPKRGRASAAALLGCLLAPAAPIGAAEPVAPPPADPAHAAGEAAIYHTPAEKMSVGLANRFAGQVTFSGPLEVKASANSSGSDLVLATAQFGLGVRVDQTISGTDPLTQQLGETKQAALLGTVTADWLVLSGFVFSGGARRTGDEKRIEDLGAGLMVTPTPCVELGVSYLPDRADTDAGPLAAVGDRYQRRGGGWSAYAVAALGPLDLAAEGLGAIGDSAAADGGCRPTAWKLEAAWEPVPTVELAPRHEWGEDLPGGVQRRYGAAASWSPREQVSITAELLRVEREGGSDSTVTPRFAPAS